MEFKQKSALGFGATHAPDTDEAAALVRELTHGVMADSVIVSPSLIAEDDVQAALSLTRKGGTCVLTGCPPDDEFDRDQPAGVHPVEQDIAGTVTARATPGRCPRFARLYEAGLLQLDEMITRRYSTRRHQRGLP